MGLYDAGMKRAKKVRKGYASTSANTTYLNTTPGIAIYGLVKTEKGS